MTRRIPVDLLVNRPESPKDDLRLFKENGRYYLKDWVDIHPHPCDEAERRRQDLLTALYLDAFRDVTQADLEPLFGRRYRVLDVGSGTGDWGIEMARTRPDVEVLGIDLVGPDEGLEKPGPNWRFISGVDFESDDWGPWAEEGEWDLIRCGFLVGYVGDWERLLGKIRSLLRPNGQVEIVDIDWHTYFDGLIPPHSPYAYLTEAIEQAAADFGKPLTGVLPQIQRLLDTGGFSMRTNIRERLSIVEDCDPLADMERQNRLARRHRELLIDPSLGHFEGLAMRLLTQGGHQARNVRRLCRAARLELAAVELEADFHPYHSLNVYTARKTLD